MNVIFKTDIEGFTLREAAAEDVPVLLSLIRELAVYEKLTDQVTATEESMKLSLFGIRPGAEALLGELDGEPVAYAVYFHNYSTFAGRLGLYLEDVYVKPELRGKGMGKVILSYLARLAKERGCARFEWSVLDWNEPSIRFYRSLGAVPLDGWTIFRMTGEALDRLAGI
ncbi:MAG: GNAT family N-acetyltransferase [Synergistales bacterium]|nr:GNAT family N-acetyltransferase [Synergistales bacterium]